MKHQTVVYETIVPLNQQPSILYWRLSDFRFSTNRNDQYPVTLIQPDHLMASIECHIQTSHRKDFPSCFLHSDFELENFMIFIALIVLVWFGSSWVAFKTSRANISWDVQPNQEVSIKIADFAEKTVYQKSNFLDDSPKCATCKLCKLSLSLICVIYVTLVS